MNESIKNILRTQRILYSAQAGMLLIFALIVYYLISTGQLGPPDYSIAVLLQTIILVLVPASLGAGYFIFKSMLSKIDRKMPMMDKLRKYLTLVIVRSAFLELPGLFCCVAALITVDYLFLAGVPIILFVFLFLRPTVQAISEDLNLSANEKKQLESQWLSK
jgi:hypothetical protein